MLASILIFLATTLQAPPELTNALIFDELLHNINYGEVIQEVDAKKFKLNINSAEGVVKDSDGMYRKFAIESFNRDIDKEFPRIINRCLRMHAPCQYVEMYRLRHEEYKKLYKLRLQYVENLERCLQIEPKFRPLFRRQDY